MYLGEDGGVYANSNCKYLFSHIVLIDLGNFNTSYVTDMSYMFNEMNYLTSINLGFNFDTSSVEDMGYIFAG